MDCQILIDSQRFEPKNKNMDIKETDSEVPPSAWLAVGLLDGTWAGGKVMVTVDVISPMPKIHLVHLFAEKISKQNGFVKMVLSQDINIIDEISSQLGDL